MNTKTNPVLKNLQRSLIELQLEIDLYERKLRICKEQEVELRARIEEMKRGGAK